MQLLLRCSAGPGALEEPERRSAALVANAQEFERIPRRAWPRFARAIFARSNRIRMRARFCKERFRHVGPYTGGVLPAQRGGGPLYGFLNVAA